MSNYFSYLPNFDYVNRIPGEQNISSYTQVKNLFKRVKLNNEMFQDLTNFTKYTIKGDDRPDMVAKKVYGNSNYDWIILLSNNIINIQDEWPIDSNAFTALMNRKYGDANYNAPHHYESIEIKDTSGNFTILEKGLEVPSDFSITYFDAAQRREIVIDNTNVEISNFEYETRIQDKKRNIFLLRDTLIQTAIKDIRRLMSYKDGSTQYVNKKLIRGENINLF